MKKTFSKMLGVIISVVLLSDIATSSVFAFNQEAEMNKEVQVIAVIEVSDPISGEVSTFEEILPKSALQTNDIIRSGETFHSVKAEIDLGKYITPRSSSDKEENYDGVIISSGITYTQSGNKFKSTKLYGDIDFPNSMYYATNRHYNCRDTSMNVWNCCKNKNLKCPTSKSWSLNTGCSQYETISSDIPPFVRYEAKIGITDMTSYRNVSVTCKLDFT